MPPACITTKSQEQDPLSWSVLLFPVGSAGIIQLQQPRAFPSITPGTAFVPLEEFFFTNQAGGWGAAKLVEQTLMFFSSGSEVL